MKNGLFRWATLVAAAAVSFPGCNSSNQGQAPPASAVTAADNTSPTQVAADMGGVREARGQTTSNSRTSTERDRSPRLVVSDFRETPEEVRVENLRDHMIVEFRNSLNRTVSVDVLKPNAKRILVNPEGKLREYLPNGIYTMKFVADGAQPARRVDIRLNRSHVYICEITLEN